MKPDDNRPTPENRGGKLALLSDGGTTMQSHYAKK